MAATGDSNTFLNIVYRLPLGLILIMVLFLLGGTFYGFYFQKETGTMSASGTRNPGNQVVQGTQAFPEEHVFTGIGRLRLSTDNSSAMVIFTVTFPYSPEDRAFSEELVARVKDFRIIAEGYFKSFTATEIQNKNEQQIKTELLERFNRVLRLGKIQTLYFNDFMILE